MNRYSEIVRHASGEAAEQSAAEAEQGAANKARCIAKRAADPLASFLLETFTRQVRQRGEKAMRAERAGLAKLALEQARSAVMADENAGRVRAAIAGESQ